MRVCIFRVYSAGLLGRRRRNGEVSGEKEERKKETWRKELGGKGSEYRNVSERRKEEKTVEKMI